MCKGDVGSMRCDRTKMAGVYLGRCVMFMWYCDKCNFTKLSYNIKVGGRCAI